MHGIIVRLNYNVHGPKSLLMSFLFQGLALINGTQLITSLGAEGKLFLNICSRVHNKSAFVIKYFNL